MFDPATVRKAPNFATLCYLIFGMLGLCGAVLSWSGVELAEGMARVALVMGILCLSGAAITAARLKLAPVASVVLALGIVMAPFVTLGDSGRPRGAAQPEAGTFHSMDSGEPFDDEPYQSWRTQKTFGVASGMFWIGALIAGAVWVGRAAFTQPFEAAQFFPAVREGLARLLRKDSTAWLRMLGGVGVFVLSIAGAFIAFAVGWRFPPKLVAFFLLAGAMLFTSAFRFDDAKSS